MVHLCFDCIFCIAKDFSAKSTVEPIKVKVSHDVKHEGVEITMVIEAPKTVRPEKRRPRPKQLLGMLW